MTTMTHEEWLAEAELRFGKDPMEWRFVCPSCGYVAKVRDWKEAGAREGEVAFSCIGRRTGSTQKMFSEDGGPCNYAGGGLFRLNPVNVVKDGKTHSVFAFAEASA